MSIFAKVIALLIALTGLVLGVNHWVSGERDVAFKAGAASIQKLWDKDREQANQALIAANNQVVQKEHELQIALSKQEVKDANAKKTITQLATQLASMQLRDPNAAHSVKPNNSSASTNDSRNDTSETNGLLSEELTGLLQSLTRDADEINAAYASCQQNAFEVRGLTLP